MRDEIKGGDRIADPKAHYGDGKTATRHFLTQRVTGAVNVVSVGFLVWLVVRLAGVGRAEMVGVVGNPAVGVILALLLVVALIHMRNGMRDVVEDYVTEPRTNTLTLQLNTVFTVAVGLVGLASIFKLVVWG